MRFVIASKNRHKIEEFARILESLSIEVISPSQLPDFEAPEETGETFEENAHIKAKALFERFGLPVVADDSGLEVDVLDGAPGVYSARYCGEKATDEERYERILFELADVPHAQRTARFVCSICCIVSDDICFTVRGVCEGFIGEAPRGEGGFGYDPIFYVGEKSFAELSGEEKDRISHRGKAAELFLKQLTRILKENDKRHR